MSIEIRRSILAMLSAREWRAVRLFLGIENMRLNVSEGAAAAQAVALFRFGRSDFLNVLAAQNSFAVAQVDSAEAQASLVDDQITLFLALGGGWGR